MKKKVPFQVSGLLASRCVEATLPTPCQWALTPLDRALAMITVMISPESGTWNGAGEPRPFIKLIMNRLWEASAEMLAAGFLAFWLRGLDTAGRSSVGKSKLIRPGVWLCFECPVFPRYGAVSVQWREVRGHAPGLGSPGHFVRVATRGRGIHWVGRELG